MTVLSRRSSLRRNSVPGAAVVALTSFALLATACTSLPAAADRYFTDAVVGALDIADSGRVTGFTVLDSAVDGYDLFLAGEAHGVVENLDFTYKLFQYLHDRRGVRTYLAEIGFAAGEQLNDYVQGAGTDADLQSIMDSSRGTYAWTSEWFAFWRRLRLWNARLAPDQRIRVVGIDVEHQVDRGFTYIADRLTRSPAPSGAIEAIAERLANWQALGRAACDDTVPGDRASGDVALRTLAADAFGSLSTNEPEWVAFLGDSFDPVRIALRNIVRRYEYYEDPRNAEIREAAAYANFLDVYSLLGEGERRFVGLWGSVHIPTAPVNGFAWLAARLARDSPVAGAVFTIAPFYDRSTALRTFPYRTSPLSSDRLTVRLLVPYAKTSATLFYLDGDGSPFRSSPALSPDLRTPTTEMYKAAVLFTGGRASSALEAP